MNDQLNKLTKFEWNDPYSNELLELSELKVNCVKKDLKLENGDNVRYSGEMAGDLRHGRGV